MSRPSRQEETRVVMCWKISIYQYILYPSASVRTLVAIRVRDIWMHAVSARMRNKWRIFSFGPNMMGIERTKKKHSKQAPSRRPLDENTFFTRYTVFAKVCYCQALRPLQYYPYSVQFSRASWHPFDRLPLSARFLFHRTFPQSESGSCFRRERRLCGVTWEVLGNEPPVQKSVVLVLQRFKFDRRTRLHLQIHVLVLSGEHDEDHALKLYKSGVVRRACR